MSVPSLVPGANHPVPPQALNISVTLSPQQIGGVDVDLSAFLLTASGKVRGDADMVFYGQPRSGDGKVLLTATTPGQSDFSVDVPNLSKDIEKIAFTATIHENKATFSAFNSVRLSLADASGQPVLDMQLAAADMPESALILGELYLRQGQWKFRAVGQGFTGGLKPLAEYFGVDISDAPAAAALAPVPPPSASAKVSLSKITLDKTKPRVSLDKKAEGFGEIRVNLNWNQRSTQEKKSGLLGGIFGGAKGIDLDVGCLYELQNGTLGTIQALGRCFGSYEQEPYILLKGDDRTGASTEGEWLHINGQCWQHFKRILIYAFIYEGSPNWARTDGVVTVYVPNESPLEIRLTEGANYLNMCAIVLLENINGALQVNRENRYFSGHKQMDAHYHWGLQWRAGSK